MTLIADDDSAKTQVTFNDSISEIIKFCIV